MGPHSVCLSSQAASPTQTLGLKVLLTHHAPRRSQQATCTAAAPHSSGFPAPGAAGRPKPHPGSCEKGTGLPLRLESRGPRGSVSVGLVCTGVTLPLGELVSGGVAACPLPAGALPQQAHPPLCSNILHDEGKTEALLLFLLKHKIN